MYVNTLRCNWSSTAYTQFLHQQSSWLYSVNIVHGQDTCTWVVRCKYTLSIVLSGSVRASRWLLEIKAVQQHFASESFLHTHTSCHLFSQEPYNCFSLPQSAAAHNFKNFFLNDWIFRLVDCAPSAVALYTTTGPTMKFTPSNHTQSSGTLFKFMFPAVISCCFIFKYFLFSISWNADNV